MKQLIGVFILLLGVALAVLLALRIWGVTVVSQPTLLHSGATLLVVAGALVGLIIVWFGFFKNPAAGYQVRTGRQAHPKADARPENTPSDFN